MLYFEETSEAVMKKLLIFFLFIFSNWAIADDSTVTLSRKGLACTSKQDFENVMDYVKHKDQKLFEKMLYSANAPCQEIPKGEQVFVRKVTFDYVSFRRKGQEVLLYSNYGIMTK